MSEPFTEEQKAAIKDIVHEALVEFFSSNGKLTKNLLIGTATIIGSLLVIFGGIKTVLAWIGFSYLSR